MDSKEKTAFILLLDKDDGIFTIFAQKYKNIELAEKNYRLHGLNGYRCLNLAAKAVDFTNICTYPQRSCKISNAIICKICEIRS